MFDWLLRKKKPKYSWKTGEIPPELNESQLACVEAARFNYHEFLRTKNRLRLVNCFWYMIFAHFKSMDDVFSGYSLDLPLPAIIERAKSAMEPVLLSKLEEIIGCTDAKLKAELTFKYILIVMSAVFDASGSHIHYEIFREVLNAEELPCCECNELRDHRGSFLEPLGFKPHPFTEDGEQYTTWYWPRQ